MSKNLISKVKSFIKLADLFYSSEMLRYQNEETYRTFTGGIFSIAIIIVTFIGFASMIIDTLNQTSFTTSYSVYKNDQPTYSQFTSSPDNNFMFGVAVSNLNLTESIRYFDIISLGRTLNRTRIPLEPCTQKHWSSKSNFMATFNKLGGTGSICPQIGQQFEIFGKISSQLMSSYSIQISKCNNSTDMSRPCASQQQITKLFQNNDAGLQFALYYINPIINSDYKEYKSYYIQDANYVRFGQNIGAQAYMYFTDYNVNTDNSIWPFQKITSDTGVIVQSLPINRAYQIKTNSTYASFNLVKSADSITYTRQVSKLTYVFSYIGGMISAISTALFFIKIYTSFSYEIQIALSVFKCDKNIKCKNQNPSLGFLSFIKYNIYIICQKLGFKLEWSGYQFISQCQTEIIEQLDIKQIIKRIIFLEHCITHIFEDYQINALRYIVPYQPKQVLQIRNTCNIRDRQECKQQGMVRQRQMEIIKEGVSEGAETKGRLKVNNHIIIEDINSIENDDRQNKIKVIKQNLDNNVINNEYQQGKLRKNIIKNLEQSVKKDDQLSKRIWYSWIKFYQQNQQNKQNESQMNLNINK